MTSNIAPSRVEVPATLVAYLAHRYSDIDLAQRPIDKKAARAKFEGACGAVYATREYGFGTPDHVFLVIVDAIREVGPRDNGYGTSGQRVLWEDAVTEYVRAHLR